MSAYMPGLLEPRLPERDGSVLCVRSVTFLRQMRAEGERHLTAAPLEKALRQLICRKQPVVFSLLPGGSTSGSGSGLGGGQSGVEHIGVGMSVR